MDEFSKILNSVLNADSPTENKKINLITSLCRQNNRL